jgi:hypothetical protein
MLSPTRRASTGHCVVCRASTSVTCQFPLGGRKAGQFCGRHLCGKHIVHLRDPEHGRSFALCATHALMAQRK